MKKKLNISNEIKDYNEKGNIIDWKKELNKKQPVVNKKLKKQLEERISELIDKKYRKEALDILLKTDSKLLGDFLYYYYSNIGNVACMVIDKAKSVLVKNGKLNQIILIITVSYLKKYIERPQITWSLLF